MDNIRVVKLPHDACFTQEVSPLFVRVPDFQGFYGHSDISFPWKFQTATAHFSKFSWSNRTGRCVLISEVFPFSKEMQIIL